ncbi:probable F-actin-capping protein subunit beta, partial [Tanacetum coccineum]
IVSLNGNIWNDTRHSNASSNRRKCCCVPLLCFRVAVKYCRIRHVLCDEDSGTEFILCEYNRDADSYRYYEGGISSVYCMEGGMTMKAHSRPAFLFMKADVSVEDGHLCNMGKMIEELEGKLRNQLDQALHLPHRVLWKDKGDEDMYTSEKWNPVVEYLVQNSWLSLDNNDYTVLHGYKKITFVKNVDANSVLIAKGTYGEGAVLS